MGVHRVEGVAPERLPALHDTVAKPEREACLAALNAAISLYRDLREAAASGDEVHRRTAAEDAAMQYLAGI